MVSGTDRFQKPRNQFHNGSCPAWPLPTVGSSAALERTDQLDAIAVGIEEEELS